MVEFILPLLGETLTRAILFFYVMQKNIFIITLICLLATLTACQKTIDTAKIKGTWTSDAGTVVIEDSTMSYPPATKKHVYKIENDSTLVIYFDMDSVIRTAVITIEKLDADSFVVNNDYRTGYRRVK